MHKSLYVIRVLNSALQFREDHNAMFIHEGHSPIITIERSSLHHSVGVKIYVTTLGDYFADACNLTLDDLGINQSQADPAECT